MVPFHHICFLSLLITLAIGFLPGTHAVDYYVTNTAGGNPGGIRLNNEIGANYSRQTLISTTDFIWSFVSKVTLIVENIIGIAFTINNEIHVSASYIADGVLYYESTHVWQWNGNSQAPPGGGVVDIADYVRLKASYAPSHWVKPGQGDRWDQVLRNGLVAEMNKKLRSGYSNVDQLWSGYKAKYARN
ncbi:hypothetical protein D8674_003839 [Pyrus ussuriensis x Pyrus communis]|uniref:Uncharacterized protein n=1 Tax=Pyrus ussuriensis x Pyrus communis TaxID=2448454 RepID=A0A5N5FX17_9ROSA|nr:hypothetical protein D8674_003839 [Pyrus ussuriensis x Pyrus communis]